jgi:Transposase
VPHRHTKRRGARGGQVAHKPRSPKTTLGFGALAAYRHRNGTPLPLGLLTLGGVRPRGVGGQCPQVEVHLLQSKHKTDELDAENLARLARLDSKLLYPLKHRSENAQAHMAIICSRQALVDCRTQLVNHLRGTVKSFGARLPKCPARSFHKRGPQSTSRRHSGPRATLGADRFADGTHPRIRPEAGGDL